jgi:predicted CoA-binding protein
MAAEIVREDPMIEDSNIKGLLERSRTIAVLGVSNKPERDSHRVAAYLQQVGYRMIPVNPILEEVLGQTCYPDLASIPDDIEVDIVDVFRRAEFVLEIVEDAIERGARSTRSPTVAGYRPLTSVAMSGGAGESSTRNTWQLSHSIGMACFPSSVASSSSWQRQQPGKSS